MSFSSLKNKISRLEKGTGIKDAFSEFMDKVLDLIGKQPTFLPCDAKNVEADHSEFEQLRRDYPEGARLFNEWIKKIEAQGDAQ